MGIGQKPDGAFGLDLDITITVAGLTEDEARKLITRAHEVCPYSNATRGNVDVRLHVNVIQSLICNKKIIVIINFDIKAV